MNEQQMREIAEAAFKRQFADARIVRINIRQRLGFDDDPVVDVNIIYDDNYRQTAGRDFSPVRSEIVDKTWREGKDDLGYPLAHLIAKSGLGQHDPATV